LALESQITNRILKYLNGLEDCVAEKVMGNAFQFGRPDINACWKGRSVRIEVKTPDHGNKPSKAQELNLRQWSKAGALAFVAYSLEDVKEIIFDGVGD
jgi:hypothetical protein